MRKYFAFFFLLFFPFLGYCQEEIFLRDFLPMAKKGDYVVTSRNKNYTVLTIKDKILNSLVIEEITICENRFTRTISSWKTWVEQGAPHHTGWVSYIVELPSGKVQDHYSYTHKSWYKIDEENNLFTTLLNLKFAEIPLSERKRSNRSHWQPKMVVNGTPIPNVPFIPYRTLWPKDGTEIAGKTVEIYLPQENALYPSYFPYFMQISGTIGKAYIRIIDSGSNLFSPQQLVLKK